MSHAGFLRGHHTLAPDEVAPFVRAIYAAAETAAQWSRARALDHLFDEADEAVATSSPSFAPDRALIRLSLRLAFAPATMDRSRLDPLRADGWTDREIHDAVAVVCCFSYMNRLADGLGVALETSTWAVELLGPERWEAHRRWAVGDATE